MYSVSLRDFETAPSKVVVYFRTRPSEPVASDAAVAKQRAAVTTWLAKHGVTPVSEFTEAEGLSNARPQLGQALEACRQQQAALLLAMTDAIGSGPTLGTRWTNDLSGVRCVAITHAELEPKRPPPEPPIRVPLPGLPRLLPPADPRETMPSRPCLCFEKTTTNDVGVFFCNPSADPVTAIVVESVGTLPSENINTSTSRRSIDVVQPNTCVQVDRYDRLGDGDLITDYAICYTDRAGARFEGVVTIGKGGPSRRWWVPKPSPQLR